MLTAHLYTSVICVYVGTCISVHIQSNKVAEPQRFEVLGCLQRSSGPCSYLQQGHQDPVAQNQVHNIFKKRDSITSLGSLVPVVSQPQSKKVFYCGILLTFRRSLLCFCLWQFPMVLLLGTTEKSLTPSHGVPFTINYFAAGWLSESTDAWNYSYLGGELVSSLCWMQWCFFVNPFLQSVMVLLHGSTNGSHFIFYIICKDTEATFCPII